MNSVRSQANNTGRPWLPSGRLVFLAALVALVPVFSASGAGWCWAADAGAPQYAGFGDIDPAKQHFIVLGDTQRTSRWEFWRERNDRERKLIVDEIARRDPAFIVHLGDLTVRGSSDSHWAEFDENHRTIRRKKIPYFPVLGNHELCGSEEQGLQHFFGRFPHLGNKRWYSFIWRNVGFILLDSNFTELGPEQSERQRAWYNGQLARFEGDGTIDHVIVCCHKPPFTNRRVRRPSEESRVQFAEPFLRARKTRLFLNGHCHSYERFEVNGKTFIVSGGGGGPRHKVHIDPKTRPYNDLFDGPELRFFHFCEIEWRDGALAYRVIRLNPDGTFQAIDPLTFAVKPLE